MLIVTFHNVCQRGNIADYEVQVFVNHDKIGEGRFEDHDRGTGWKGLILDFADRLKSGKFREGKKVEVQTCSKCPKKKNLKNRMDKAV